MMDDNQIAELFIDIYDNHWGAGTKFNDYVLPEESELAAYIQACCVIGLRAYANREPDVAKLTHGLIDAMDEVNISAKGFLSKTWMDLCEEHAKNPELDFSSFADFVSWQRPQFSSIGQLIESTSKLDLATCFGTARYVDYSAGVIEDVADRFYKEFVNAESQLVRFAFYGALYSMHPSDPRVAKLNEKLKAEEENAFLIFVLDEIDVKGTRHKTLQNMEIEALQASVPRVISSMEELSGVAIADFHPHAPSYDKIEENGVDPILSKDFEELQNLQVVDFLDYIAFTWDLAYPKALYLAVANPFVTFDIDIPDSNAKTFYGEWEFYIKDSYNICNALTGDFRSIFHTVPRVLSFYSLQAVVERTEDLGQFAWDPYRSILFTRTDISEAQRTEYLTERLQNITATDIDESSPIDGTGAYDIEIACLFEVNEKMHQQIFDIGSTLLNLSLLLNPSISDALRKKIGDTGLEIEFVEGFDSPQNITLATGLDIMIERAETYKDPGLAAILRNLDLSIHE
jgi:hypothetical protein